MSSVSCDKQPIAVEKKHEKRGIYDEGYGDFGGDFGHNFEEDHHHVHHHHEKTIYNVKKVLFILIVSI